MAQAGNQDLTERFIQFYRNYYREEIGTLAQRYPNEQRSLYVDYDDLYQFDRDLAEDFLTKPDQMREYAEEAIRLYDLPADVSLGRAHVRVENLPENIEIRGIRVHDDHIGKLVSVQGIVRKATDVRPKVTEAAFECQRCGTMTYIPQSDGGFQEPHECQGCERQGPFRVNFDQSEFIDSQKLRIQESPEGLRGGETPQSLDVDIEDDITGKVSPGDHVTCVGVLHIEQIEQGNEKTAVFDLYMDGVAIAIEDEEFEDMDITDADRREIIELSNRDDVYEAMVNSIAPAIYGYEEEKLAMILQLFSGVTKHLPDGSRIRGDLHMLLIGDPGTGKSQLLSYIRQIAPRSVYTSGKGSSSAGLCVTGDTKIHTANGFVPIREIANQYHADPVNEETAVEATHELYSFDRDAGDVELTESSHVWRMPEKPCRQIETAHGKQLEASISTPVLVCNENGLEWRKISDVSVGEHVAVPKYTDIERSSPSVRTFVEFTEEKLKPTNESIEFIRTRLCDEFGTLRDAANALGLPEDFIYDSLSNRHLSLDRSSRVLTAIDVDLHEIDIERAMLRHGDSVAIPDEFDADLMYLIGLVFGDGDVMVSRRGENRGHVRISNSDEELLTRASDIINAKFDKEVAIEYQDDRVPCIRLHSATVARFFSNVGVESPKNDIALDPKLTVAEHADAFLQGLFDADGAVCGRENGGSSVQFSTTCSDLAEQVRLMLETYGIRSRTRERDRRGTYERADGYEIESTSVQTHLSIYGTDLDEFADRIGFRSSEKSKALDAIVGDAKRRGERVPVADALARTDGGAGQYWQNIYRGDNPSRSRAQSIIDDLDLGEIKPTVEEVVKADLVWDEVVAAEETGEKEVFDLTVPDTHNFIGNGIVTHNTAAAVRDDFGDGQQWTLEAGALVLADKGIAAVDELDKMRCVTGETLVHLGNGRVSRIREIAREAEEDGQIESLRNGRTIRDVDLDVWTMAPDGSLTRRDVTAVHEYESPEELTEVSLESGESVTVTEDHPFFVLENGTRTTRAAADLQPGDWAFVPDTLPHPASDGGVEATTGPIETYRETATALGAVLGYLSGDGNVHHDREHGSYALRFTNTEEELLEDFERACRNVFDVEPIRPPSEQRDDGKETVRVTGKACVDRVLDAGMNLETYEDKAFPATVSEGDSRMKAAFIRAMADSEGTVDEHAGFVRISSASYELLMGIKSLLLEFGITTQIRKRNPDPPRQTLYTLTITSESSLDAFKKQIGFTLSRKQASLETVCRNKSGDRTILDVIPDCGDMLYRLRQSLRLHQSECGINAATYCDFENDAANVSFFKGRSILETFEERVRVAEDDYRAIRTPCSWETLKQIKNRYHVSQTELADGTAYTQQAVSRLWGRDDDLRSTVRGELSAVVDEVRSTDLEELASLVRGNVKWRRIESVEFIQSSVADDRIPLLKRQLTDLLGGPIGTVEKRANELLNDETELSTWAELREILERYDISQRSLATDLGVDQSTVSRWFDGTVTTDRFDDVVDVAIKNIRARRGAVRSLLEEIEERRRPKVYDLTVEGTHNFVANGMVVHNSEDRSAMHQALEQQQISVNKAGINATLKSRCSLLGAANPKYGRFDQYEPIGEQIDLEPALISRFDLIFTVTDQPDPEHDARLAKHIIKTNYAGELNTQREKLPSSEFTAEQVANVTDEVAPEIDAELLRKYIAHAKRDCYPTMTDEAKDLIEEFYVDLRSKGADEDAPVPVTARKLEALVRLAEASARVRLSDTVEREDADRATDIVESCLQDIGVDPETGQFDADVVETGTSKSQRDRIKNIKGLIADTEEEYEEGAPVEEVLDRAGEIGMDRSKAEREIEKLRTKGEVYEPKQGHLRTT